MNYQNWIGYKYVKFCFWCLVIIIYLFLDAGAPPFYQYALFYEDYWAPSTKIIGHALLFLYEDLWDTPLYFYTKIFFFWDTPLYFCYEDYWATPFIFFLRRFVGSAPFIFIPRFLGKAPSYSFAIRLTNPLYRA